MANFSSIKFNNVDYPLKDASARADIAQLQETVGEAVDDIASLQTSVSGLDTRVTALEQEVPEGVQVITLDTYYDTLGTTIEGLSDLDYDKPIYLLVRTGQVLSSESGDGTVFAVLDDEENEYTFASQFIKYGESVENKDTPQEVVHKYFYLTSTSGESFKFNIDPENNMISGGTREQSPDDVHTHRLPTENDYAGMFDAYGPDTGRAYHISDELYDDLMSNDVTVLFTGSLNNFVSGAQLASNKKQGRFTLILDNGQVLEFWAQDLSDYGYGKCLCYDDDYVYDDGGLYAGDAKFDTVKHHLDSSGKVVAVGFGKYPEKAISDGFSKVSGNSLESLTLDNYDYSKGYFNGSFTYEGMTIKSQPIQGFTSLPDGPRWYGYFTSTTGDILYITSSYSEEQGGVMVTTAQIIPSGYYEVADIDALHALIRQKGKNLPIDKPYHFTTTFTYVYYDTYEVEHQVTFLPQSTNLMLDPDASEEEGEYRFDMLSSKNKKYRINISPSGFEYVDELFIETNVALPPESACEPYKLRNIRVNGAIGIIPSDDNYTPYCQFVDYDVDDKNVLCLWLCDVNDEDTNNEIAKSLYYGIKPVITNATEIDYTDSEGYERVFTVAQGEVKLEKVRDYYRIYFRKPLSSPDDTRTPYYSGVDQWLGRDYVLEPRLKLVDGVPKITFEIVA